MKNEKYKMNKRKSIKCSKKEEYELIDWFIDFKIQLIYEATASLHQNISE